MTEAEVAQRLGPLDVLSRELKEFSRSARVFSGDSPRLIERYPEQWVAVVDGDIATHANTFVEVLGQLDEMAQPREHAMVRFVTKHKRTMIL